MSESSKHIIYFSYDADSAGRKVGNAVLDNDPEALAAISERIKLGNLLIEKWAKDRNGKQYSSGGDQGVYAIDSQYVSELEHLRTDYHYLTGLTISVGIGDHLSESGQALLMAKLKGKDRIVHFDKKTKKEIASIKKRVKKGHWKSMEEYKLGESYLKKSEIAEDDCPYCNQSDGIDPAHCKWCHDASPQEGEENCPYCKDMQNDPAEGAQLPEVGEEDCAYCNEMDENGQDNCPYCAENDDVGSTLLAPKIGTSPDSQNEAAPAGSPEEQELYGEMGMNPPEIGKPAPPDQRPPIGQNAPMDVVPEDPEMQGSRFVDGDHGSSAAPAIDPEDNSSMEAMQAIATAIETDADPSTKEVNAIDDSEMPVSTEAEGNISRPSGFGQNTPQDMGQEGPNPPVGDSDDEEDPDFYSVLEDGLDDHADGIARERTIQVVSQALTQFKACKQTLENVKMQAPDLYAASISMLKAMIEMASLLGLGPSNVAGQPQQELGSVQSAITPEVAQPAQAENEWNDPFPTHPDQGGEAKPGHSPSKNNPKGAEKEGGAIGQSIGKLSSKHTTEHVARVPTPPGAINEKGQQKVIDPKTGETRWIDRKQGMVQSATGVPVKAPSRGPQ